MATFKAEINNRRADGTYNVRIRITHNREVRRMSTHIFVTDEDITRSLRIKNQQVLDQCEDLIRKCRKACNAMEFHMTAMPIDALVTQLLEHLRRGDTFRLDFFTFAAEVISGMSPGTASSYNIALNCLRRYVGAGSLDISEISASFLGEFERFIEAEPSQQGGNRADASGGVAKPKGGRAVSAYLACVRAIHNKAKIVYNDEDRGIIRIPYSPFKNFKIKPQPITRKRAISVEAMQAIIDLPYRADRAGARFNLAKDCFILSFAFMGMNSVDLYNASPAKRNVLIYNRTKTASRRADKAEMRVKIDASQERIVEEYRDQTGVRMFDFYKKYSSSLNFNKALNFGLKQIGAMLELEALEFYAARHTWATIARSSAVGIDKATVHEALNHVDADMRVTDIYIDRDWSVLWKANKKVLALFDWSAVGYDVL